LQLEAAGQIPIRSHHLSHFGGYFFTVIDRKSGSLLSEGPNGVLAVINRTDALEV